MSEARRVVEKLRRAGGGPGRGARSAGREGSAVVGVGDVNIKRAKSRWYVSVGSTGAGSGEGAEVVNRRGVFPFRGRAREGPGPVVVGRPRGLEFRWRGVGVDVRNGSSDVLSAL